MNTNDLTGEVIGAAIEVHKELDESMGQRRFAVGGRIQKTEDGGQKEIRSQPPPLKLPPSL